MMPADAGRIAERAHTRRMLLTHFSDELQEEALIAEAAAHFTGPIDVARAGAAHRLEPAARRAGSGSRRVP
jgi:ribonuclease BN (tRNA processing enzyme)